MQIERKKVHSSAAHCLRWTWDQEQTSSKRAGALLQWLEEGRFMKIHIILSPPPQKSFTSLWRNQMWAWPTWIRKRRLMHTWRIFFQPTLESVLSKRRFNWSLAFGKIWAKAANVFWNLGYRTWQIRFLVFELVFYCVFLVFEFNNNSMLWMSIS